MVFSDSKFLFMRASGSAHEVRSTKSLGACWKLLEYEVIWGILVYEVEAVGVYLGASR